MITDQSVHIDNVMKTPQFWQIWFCFGSLATTGRQPRDAGRRAALMEMLCLQAWPCSLSRATC